MQEHPKPDDEDQSPDQQPNSDGQVSDAESLRGEPDPISPEDATAGYPISESGHPEEGTAGPDAAPRHDPSTPGKRAAR